MVGVRDCNEKADRVCCASERDPTAAPLGG